jgi:hypothetical protein
MIVLFVGLLWPVSGIAQAIYFYRTRDTWDEGPSMEFGGMHGIRGVLSLWTGPLTFLLFRKLPRKGTTEPVIRSVFHQ